MLGQRKFLSLYRGFIVLIPSNPCADHDICSSSIHFQIKMSAKTVGTPAVKFVETLQGAIIVRADQDTILIATYGHVKVIFQLI